MNLITVVFRTEQEVGSELNRGSGIWVDGPLNYDFGLYCLVKDLPEIYYVFETTKLPRGSDGTGLQCEGRVIPLTTPNIGTYNRAVIDIPGRLVKNTRYGFKVRLDNAPDWSMTSLNEWKIWTYEMDNTQEVDGSYNSPRFNGEVAEGQSGKSFGVYQTDFASYEDEGSGEVYSEGFVVTIGDLRPQGVTTSITIFPIVLPITCQ